MMTRWWFSDLGTWSVLFLILLVEGYTAIDVFPYTGSPAYSSLEDAGSFQLFLDPHDAPALPIPAEDPSHDFCFLLIDDKLLPLVTVIPEAEPGEGGGVGIACAFPDAPFDAGALVLALSPGKGFMER